MTHKCPVEDGCQDVAEIKLMLRRWGTAILTVVILIGGAAMYTWANALRIPELVTDVKNHEKRLTITETRQQQIFDNTEDIKTKLDSLPVISGGRLNVKILNEDG